MAVTPRLAHLSQKSSLRIHAWCAALLPPHRRCSHVARPFPAPLPGPPMLAPVACRCAAVPHAALPASCEPDPHKGQLFMSALARPVHQPSNTTVTGLRGWPSSASARLDGRQHCWPEGTACRSRLPGSAPAPAGAAAACAARRCAAAAAATRSRPGRPRRPGRLRRRHGNARWIMHVPPAHEWSIPNQACRKKMSACCTASPSPALLPLRPRSRADTTSVPPSSPKAVRRPVAASAVRTSRLAA